MRLFVLVAALLGLSAMAPIGMALAQHTHSHGSKGPNGGVLQDVAGVHAELVLAGSAITIHILDEQNKPLPTAGYTGQILIVSAGERETVQLAPSGNVLKGEAKKAVAAGSAVTLVLRTAAGKSGQVKF